MIFQKPNQSHIPAFNLHQAFSTLQTNTSGLLHKFLPHHHHHHHFRTPFNLNLSSLKTHLESALLNVGNEAKHALDTKIRGFSPLPGSGTAPPSAKTPAWARIADTVEKPLDPVRRPSGSPLSEEDIEERLAGVPLYALSNNSESFVLISGARSGKSLGLFCFNKEDADALLEEMKSVDPAMRQGSQVVAVALNKVFKLKVDGVAFRLIPEMSQIKNALKEKEKNGLSHKSFKGVPVFQSQSLVLRSGNKTYRPVYFRKEDLVDSLVKASRQQGRLNPAFRQGDIQVAVLEDIIAGMKNNTASNWDDVVFIPPGFDVSTNPARM